MRKRIGLIIGAGALAMVLAACGTTEPTEALPAPTVNFSVEDNGASVLLTWDAVSGAAGYKVECDGTTIATLADSVTTYKIDGTQNVCKKVKVYAVDKDDNPGDTETLDFSMDSVRLTVYATSDTVSTDPSWVKIDFTNFTVNAITQGNVDPTLDNVGYFVYEEVGGNRYFSDASNTSVGQAREEIGFTDNTTDVLAPPSGISAYGTTSETVNAGDRFIFWSDDVNSGTYGSIDSEDNLGVIKVNSVDGYAADITVYIQKIGGLRWVKE